MIQPQHAPQERNAPPTLPIWYAYVYILDWSTHIRH